MGQYATQRVAGCVDLRQVFARHRHSVGHSSGFQYRVNPFFAGDIYGHAGRDRLLEPVEFNRDRVGADLQFRDEIAAVDVGLGNAIDGRGDIVDRNRRVADRRASRIRDRAEN